MFTNLRLTNFCSFEHVELNLSNRNRSPKHLAMIFGENGAGKSNLVHAFQILIELLRTMDVRDAYEELLSQKAILNDEKMERQLRQMMLSDLRDMKAIINDCKMIGCDDPIRAEFDFQINNSSGTYSIELSDSEIIYESLEYVLNKRRGTYFECRPGKITINHSIIMDKDFLSDIRSSCKRFWGKHTVLSIVLYELRDKPRVYGWNNLSENFKHVLSFFCSLSFHSHLSINYVNKPDNNLKLFPLRNAKEGFIPTDHEPHLDQMSRIITHFFHAINSNIQRAYYEKEISGKQIKYQLYFEKNIAGKTRSIPFNRESTGNQQLLRVLCASLSACTGDIVIIDEADAGIHDVLFQKIIEELSPAIQGQLIITSHNTMLLETSCAREAVYIINENGTSTEVKRISEYENRTYINNNIRNKYLNNDYKGIPTVSPIDFNKLLAAIFHLRFSASIS